MCKHMASRTTQGHSPGPQRCQRAVERGAALGDPEYACPPALQSAPGYPCSKTQVSPYAKDVAYTARDLCHGCIIKNALEAQSVHDHRGCISSSEARRAAEDRKPFPNARGYCEGQGTTIKQLYKAYPRCDLIQYGKMSWGKLWWYERPRYSS